MDRATPARVVRWLPCKNTLSGEEVPPFAVMKPVESKNGIITIDQPDESGSNLICMNGPFPIEVDGHGVCTFDWPTWALYETSDGTPAVGESWGSVAGEWALGKDNPGFLIIPVPEGAPEVENDAVTWVIRSESPPSILAGKLNGTLSFESSVGMSIWRPVAGVRADSGEDVTVYDWLLLSGQSLASGTKVFAAYVDGRYEVIAASCE